MATTQEIRADINKRIRDLNEKAGLELSFDELHGQIADILAIEDEQERANAFLTFHIGLLQNCPERLLERSSLYSSNAYLYQKYKNTPEADFSLSKTSISINALTKQLVTLIDPSVGEGYRMNDSQYDAVYEYEMGVLRRYNSFNEIPRIFKEWDYRCYRSDIADIEKNLGNHSYGQNPENSLDVLLAECHYKRQLIENELSQHGFIWRLFNFRKVSAYRSFMQKADDLLEEHGFNPDTHGEVAIQMLKTTVCSSLSYDSQMVQSERYNGKQFNQVFRHENNVVNEGNDEPVQDEEIKDNVIENNINNQVDDAVNNEKVNENVQENDKKDVKLNFSVIDEDVDGEGEEELEDENVKEEIKENDQPVKLSDDARRLCNEMLKIGFRPTAENVENDMKLMKEILPLLSKNPAFTEGAKRVFAANRNKLGLMSSAISKGDDSVAALGAKFDEIDSLLGKVKYDPVTAEDLENRRVKLSVDLDGNGVEKIEQLDKDEDIDLSNLFAEEYAVISANDNKDEDEKDLEKEEKNDEVEAEEDKKDEIVEDKKEEPANNENDKTLTEEEILKLQQDLMNEYFRENNIENLQKVEEVNAVEEVNDGEERPFGGEVPDINVNVPKKGFFSRLFNK